MSQTLTPAQFDALLDKDSGDHRVLAGLLHQQIRRWPWWSREWRFIEIHEVLPRQIHAMVHTVTVNGTIARDVTEILPLSALMRVAGARDTEPWMDRFQVQAGDALIGPPIRHDDPHPFGAILSALMDRRGLSRRDVAIHCGLAESTVAKMRGGYAVPQDRNRVADLAEVLKMPAGDLMAIVGLPDDAP
jgi:hypothetical protein